MKFNILDKDSSVDVDKVCDFCDLVSKKDITGFITDWKIINPILLFSTQCTTTLLYRVCTYYYYNILFDLCLSQNDQQFSFCLQVRIAELLGVAGTDVPIREIEKLTPPYKVSACSVFILTLTALADSGYILKNIKIKTQKISLK